MPTGKGGTVLYLTVCQQLKHLSKDEFLILRELCRTAKNLTNQAIYQVRQHYFEHSRYLPYEKNYAILKTSENYRLLNSNMAQQILKEVDGSFKSFFGLLKLAKQGKYPFSSCRLPKYLPKDGYATLIVGFVRLNGNRFVLPYSAAYRKHHKPVTITIPPVLADKTIKEIRIIPKADARFFEIQYTYQVEAAQRNLNPTHALAIDFGIDNLMTAVSNRGESFLIDGKRLKSINQWFNKRNTCLQSVKDKQHYGKKTTRRQAVLQRKRNNQVRDYMGKAAKQVVTYCIRNDIGTLIVGYNTTFQRSSDLGRQMNLLWSSFFVTLVAKKIVLINLCCRPCFIWGSITIITVWTNMIIINVCKFFYLLIECFLCCKLIQICAFILQGIEVTLHRCIVVRISCFAHALCHIYRVAEFGKCFGRIL